MIVVTTENIAGHRTVQTLGQCFGVVVHLAAVGWAATSWQGSRTIVVGGEIHEYTRLLEEARRPRLGSAGRERDRDGRDTAILMMRYDSAEIGETMSEIVAYGTAAVVEPVS